MRQSEKTRILLSFVCFSKSVLKQVETFVVRCVHVDFKSIELALFVDTYLYVHTYCRVCMYAQNTIRKNNICTNAIVHTYICTNHHFYTIRTLRTSINWFERILSSYVRTYYIRIIFTYVHQLQMKMFYSFVRLLQSIFLNSGKRFLSSKWFYCIIYTYVHMCELIIYIVRTYTE